MDVPMLNNKRFGWGLMGVLLLAVLAGCSTQPVSDDVAAVDSPGAICAPDQGPPFSYRKQLVVLAATLDDPAHAADLARFEQLWSQRLQQRLRDSGRVLVADASDAHLHQGEHQDEWLRQLAQRYSAQFIVVPRFHSLYASRSRFGVGDYAVDSPRVQRQIDAELLIYDGYSGARLDAFSQIGRAEGGQTAVINPAGQPVLSGAFFDTPLGRVMSAVLDAQVADSLEALACLPLMARVTGISAGELHIDAGAASGVRPGHTLRLFRRSGAGETRLGLVEIVRVFPGSVVGVYRGEEGVPRSAEGLVVRAW